MGESEFQSAMDRQIALHQNKFQKAQSKGGLGMGSGKMIWRETEDPRCKMSDSWWQYEQSLKAQT